MIQIKDIQSLEFIKTKLWVPYDPKSRTKGMYFYTLNTKPESIAKLINNEHTQVSNNGVIYNAYYYDYMDIPKGIKSKLVVNSGVTLNKAKRQRLEYYNIMDSLCPSIKTPFMLTTLSGKNFVYDLNPIIDLYSKQEKIKNTSLIRRFRAYFDTLTNITDKSITGYTGEFILVDLDDYNKYDKNTHILHNIMLLLKRSDKFIEEFKKYKMKIVFYNTKGAFLFDTSKDLVKTNYSKIKILLGRLNMNKIDTDVNTTEKEAVAQYIAVKAKSNINKAFNLSGEDDAILPEDIEDALDADDDVVDNVKSKMDDIGDVTNDEDPSEVTTSPEDEIFDNEELKKQYNDAMVKKNTTTKTEASLKRDEMLREKQKSIVVKGKTIGDITSNKTIAPIKPHKVEIDSVTNENLKTMSFPEINKTYMETTYQKDILNAVMSMNNAAIKVNIVDVKVEDTSDSLNLKETYYITLEDENRKRHNLKFDLPKLIDDKYMYINGNKKVIQEQFYPYPVIKISESEVQIVTNYNKTRIERYGTRFNRNSEKLKKMLSSDKYTMTSTRGDNTVVNKDYLTCLEYDELAKMFNIITIGSATFMFNAKELSEIFDNKEKSTLDKILIGYEIQKGSKKTPIYYDRKNPDHVDLVSVMMSYSTQEIQDEFNSMSSGKKYVYNRVYIMEKYMPMIVLLGFFEGLDKVLRKFNDDTVKFFDNTRDKRYQYIKFQDGYLGYPLSNMEACLLFNGFTEVPTGAFTIAQMNDKETYLDMFEYLYGSPYVAGALANYYDFMIDPITLEILQLLDYPTDIVSLFIYAGSLLADNDFSGDMNLSQYRMRRNEIIPVVLYHNIVRMYSRYRSTANNNNPIKLTMDQNAVIKELMACPTVEDYSTLSPMVELHKDGIVSMKGVNGMNTDRAYSLDKRAFDDSMIGVIGVSTSPDANCGKIKQLVAEPRVKNVRGFIDLAGMENVDKLNDSNILTPVEYLTPMTTTHDDAVRTAMATKQTGHVIPVEGNCPVLVSMGMDQMVHYRTGNDFSVVAKDDGKVIDYDEEANIMVVQYKDKTTQAIDLSPHVVKNGAGGFFLANKLYPKVKKNQTFKKDQILAYDPKYFKEQNQMGNRLTHGSLMKVAVISNFSTYEDSTFITRNMSKTMASNITMQKHVIVGANSNVDYIVQPGQEINAGDDLIRYETAYDDVELNRLLATVRDEMKEDIVNLGKSKISSPYTGKIEDVIIYSGVELDEMTPSLQKVVKNYYKRIKKTNDILDKYSPDTKGSVYRIGVLNNRPYGKVEPDQYGKIKGYTVGKGVLIEFYITYHDELSDGETIQLSLHTK